jgi:hypothetical protein
MAEWLGDLPFNIKLFDRRVKAYRGAAAAPWASTTAYLPI